MSFTIGINANHADSSICIFENNKLIFAIEEERINRIKHWAGTPIESIELGLEYCGIKASKIEEIYINTNPYSNLAQKTIYFIKNFLFTKRTKEIFTRQNKKFNINAEIKKKINLNSSVGLKFTDHHISHIASAFYPSGYSDAIG